MPTVPVDIPTLVSVGSPLLVFLAWLARKLTALEQKVTELTVHVGYLRRSLGIKIEGMHNESD